MKRLSRRHRRDGGLEHLEAVNDRVRRLASTSHELSEPDPAMVRRKLNGGRSERAGGPVVSGTT